MDGVVGLRKLHTLTVYHDPVIYPFDNRNLVLSLDNENSPRRDTLTIHGRHLTGAISPADVSVRTDAAVCAVVTLREDQIICLLQQPSSDGETQVTVSIGRKIKVDVGQITYKSASRLSRDLIYVIVACGVFVIIVALCIIFMCHCQNKKHNKMKREMEREIMEMEAKVATECKEGERETGR